MKNNEFVYGIFYRSHGKWYGPYEGLWHTRKAAKYLAYLYRTGGVTGPQLKSKTEIRRLRWSYKCDRYVEA